MGRSLSRQRVAVWIPGVERDGGKRVSPPPLPVKHHLLPTYGGWYLSPLLRAPCFHVMLSAQRSETCTFRKIP